MYIVFINNSPLVLTDKDPSLDRLKGEVLFYMKYSSNESISSVVQIFENSEFPTMGVIYSPDLDQLWKDFVAHFKWVEAAGGVVENPKGDRLFIHRRGYWDLPKGKLEAGESIEECAMREVEEECGVAGLQIAKALPPTYHTYLEKGEHVLKITYWFNMHCEDWKNPKPQTEEDIAAVEWIAPKDTDKVFENTFNSIAEILNYDAGKGIERSFFAE